MKMKCRDQFRAPSGLFAFRRSRPPDESDEMGQRFGRALWSMEK
jgi:hypothetical protein